MSWELILASVIASVLGATAIGFGRWIADKLAALAGLPAEVDALSKELAKQFGGNSNGIRQQVDSIQKDVRELRARLDKHIDK